MSKETDWVDSWVLPLQSAVGKTLADGSQAVISAKRRLRYLNEVFRYTHDKPHPCDHVGYQTDALVADEYNDGEWVPRVVIEAKLGSVTTHDAITYSAKAARHKDVHPYLRYGMVIGAFGDVPVRVFQHGENLDFIFALSETLDSAALKEFAAVVAAEVRTSRQIQALLTTNRQRDKERYRLVHRPLVLK